MASRFIVNDDLVGQAPEPFRNAEANLVCDYLLDLAVQVEESPDDFSGDVDESLEAALQEIYQTVKAIADAAGVDLGEGHA